MPSLAQYLRLSACLRAYVIGDDDMRCIEQE